MLNGKNNNMIKYAILYIDNLGLDFLIKSIMYSTILKLCLIFSMLYIWYIIKKTAMMMQPTPKKGLYKVYFALGIPKYLILKGSEVNNPAL